MACGCAYDVCIVGVALQPLSDRLAELLRQRPCLHADETHPWCPDSTGYYHQPDFQAGVTSGTALCNGKGAVLATPYPSVTYRCNTERATHDAEAIGCRSPLGPGRTQVQMKMSPSVVRRKTLVPCNGKSALPAVMLHEPERRVWAVAGHCTRQVRPVQTALTSTITPAIEGPGGPWGP